MRTNPTPPLSNRVGGKRGGMVVKLLFELDETLQLTRSYALGTIVSSSFFFVFFFYLCWISLILRAGSRFHSRFTALWWTISIFYFTRQILFFFLFAQIRRKSPFKTSHEDQTSPIAVIIPKTNKMSAVRVHLLTISSTRTETLILKHIDSLYMTNSFLHF